MSKSEILYVKGMNISESDGDEEEEDEEDIWDDRKLNDAYDRALRVANAEVAKRVAMSTNKKQDNEGQFKPKTEKPSPHPQSCKSGRKEQWKAGMPCRAVYEGDGQEYEAFVLRIINEKECVVRFLGYDNTEIISISALMATLGKDARTQQIEQALNEKTDDGYSQSNHVDGFNQGNHVDAMEFSDRAPSTGSTERNFQSKKKSSKKKKSRNTVGGFELPEMPLPMPDLSAFRNLNSMDIPMPPPPLTLPASDRADAEEQAVSSMLLSWYMSGYYTGLYQGLKRAKENRRK